jgi:ubiquinone/menaquinone biosynthesis C-methylase UbiE
MSAPDRLREVVAEDRVIRLVEDGIFSVLADAPHRHHYDSRAAAYDLLVGTRLYNSLMWGNSPLDYAAFAREALDSSPGGLLLEAGCGSMLFTAQAYLDCGRPIIAFDQSLAMLQRARRRLMDAARGPLPHHIMLLQADLSDLPFRPSGFQTVLCLNVLHLYEQRAALIPNLKNLLDREGHLYVTSLVKNNRFAGDRYLSALYRAGEVVRPLSSVEFKELLDCSLNQGVSYRTKGNMAYATTDK